MQLCLLNLHQAPTTLEQLCILQWSKYSTTSTTEHVRAEQTLRKNLNDGRANSLFTGRTIFHSAIQGHSTTDSKHMTHSVAQRGRWVTNPAWPTLGCRSACRPDSRNSSA